MKESNILKNKKIEEKPAAHEIVEPNQDVERVNGVSEREELNEVFFRQYIETAMEGELFSEISSAGFSPEEVQELRKGFSELSDFDKEYAFAFPYELRKKNFAFQAKAIHSGKRELSGFWKPIVENGEKTGRRLGYHVSLYDIPPRTVKDSGGQEIQSWEISGTENDHRNNDLPMAYYAEDYLHIYRTKSANYLYIISSQRATGSGHHADNSNKWGRAPSLSVIQKFNLREVDDFVRERTKEYLEQKNASK
ncbi:MAG: hypothetical protein WCG20_02555 [bacterium]